MLTVSGAYGRDYTSREAVLADLRANKDFAVRTYGASGYTSVAELRQLGHTQVAVRYAGDRKVFIVKLSEVAS